MSRYSCDSCMQTFDTLSEKRLHECAPSGPVPTPDDGESEYIKSLKNGAEGKTPAEYMEKSFQEEIRTSIEYLDTLSDDGFISEFEDVIALQNSFKNGRHVLLLQVDLGREEGIKDHRLQLLDTTVDGAKSFDDIQVEVTHFDNDDPLASLGGNTLTFIGDEAATLDAEMLHKRLCGGLEHIDDADNTSFYFLNQDPNLSGISLSAPEESPLPEHSPLTDGALDYV